MTYTGHHVRKMRSLGMNESRLGCVSRMGVGMGVGIRSGCWALGVIGAVGCRWL